MKLSKEEKELISVYDSQQLKKQLEDETSQLKKKLEDETSQLRKEYEYETSTSKIENKTEVKETNIILCPYCKEEIRVGAIKCKHCGSMLTEEKITVKALYCKKCGAENDFNNFRCIRCGEILRTEVTSKTDFSELSQYYQDEFNEICKSGETYKGKWNWAAFCFGAFWALLTKGVWLAPIICIVASIFTTGVAGIIYWFVFGIRGNYMYYCAYVKNKQLPI